MDYHHDEAVPVGGTIKRTPAQLEFPARESVMPRPLLDG
jgi:hypothetical protein